jgi:hypothetical protein
MLMILLTGGNMKHVLVCLLTIVIMVSILPAQIALTNVPDNLHFYIQPGSMDSTWVTITNTGTAAATYSLLTNPSSLLTNQVSYYPLDNSYADLITDHTASTSGTAFVLDRFSKPGSALQFNGSTQFYTQEYNLENTFSFSFWANPQSSQPMYSEGIYNSALSSKYLLYPSWGGYASRAGLGVALGTNGIMVIEHANSYMPCLLSYTANMSGWNHYTVVFSAHVPRLYINGNLIRTGIPSQKSVTYMSYQFGGYVYGNYNGFLDDVCVYNSALTAAQIIDSYHFAQNSRYQFQPVSGTLPAGQSTFVMIKMTDTALPLGIYHDYLTLCQAGISPLYSPLDVTLHVVDQVSEFIPQSPANISINLLPDNDIGIFWSPVDLSVLGTPLLPAGYRVYVSDHPGQAGGMTLLGMTVGTEFVHEYGALAFPANRRFYHVTAY